MLGNWGNWINGWIGTSSVRQSLILANVGFSVSFLLVERLVHLAIQSSNTRLHHLNSYLTSHRDNQQVGFVVSFSLNITSPNSVLYIFINLSSLYHQPLHHQLSCRGLNNLGVLFRFLPVHRGPSGPTRPFPPLLAPAALPLLVRRTMFSWVFWFPPAVPPVSAPVRGGSPLPPPFPLLHPPIWLGPTPEVSVCHRCAKQTLGGDPVACEWSEESGKCGECRRKKDKCYP